jgi:hypothetical protein
VPRGLHGGPPPDPRWRRATPGTNGLSQLLGFLVVFRYNQLYNKYGEARDAVGDLVTNLRKVAIGLGRIVALYCHSSTSYQIH